MEKNDLTNAFRLIKDFCESKHNNNSIPCVGCPLIDICIANFKKDPERWDLQDAK